jgi:hypothetical protein
MAARGRRKRRTIRKLYRPALWPAECSLSSDMKISRVVVFSVFVSIGFAQGNGADRNATVDATTPPKDGFLVKLLRPLGPYENAPINGELRKKAFEDDTIGAFTIFKEAAVAAFDQGIDLPREWGQGVGGYGERFANDLAFNGVHQTIAYGTGLLFHEDNRYFASEKTSATGRTVHALLSPFETHHDNGHVGFSFSNVLGVVGAGFLSRAWEPPSEQGGGHVARSIGYSFLGAAAYNTFREFVPDIIRKLQKR